MPVGDPFPSVKEEIRECAEFAGDTVWICARMVGGDGMLGLGWGAGAGPRLTATPLTNCMLGGRRATEPATEAGSAGTGAETPGAGATEAGLVKIPEGAGAGTVASTGAASGAATNPAMELWGRARPCCWRGAAWAKKPLLTGARGA